MTITRKIAAAISAIVFLSALATGTPTAATLVVTVLAFAAFAWSMR